MPALEYGRRVIPLLASLLLAARIVGAQVDSDSEKPIRGILPSGPLLDSAAIGARCPVFIASSLEPREELMADTMPITHACRVAGVKRLPTADGASWMLATYERTLTFPADTLVLVSAVLYSAAPGTVRWRAEWHGAVIQRSIYSISSTLAKRADGSALVSVRYCWNGTGGCWQEFMHRRAARWTAVTQAYRHQLRPIRDGFIDNGMGIDVATLRGSFAVYSPDDAHCCASRRLLVTLDLRGDSLVLKRSRVQPARE
jgi:hypothetical protein